MRLDFFFDFFFENKLDFSSAGEKKSLRQRRLYVLLRFAFMVDMEP